MAGVDVCCDVEGEADAVELVVDGAPVVEGIVVVAVAGTEVGAVGDEDDDEGDNDVLVVAIAAVVVTTVGNDDCDGAWAVVETDADVCAAVELVDVMLVAVVAGPDVVVGMAFVVVVVPWVVVTGSPDVDELCDETGNVVAWVLVVKVTEVAGTEVVLAIVDAADVDD